MDIRKESLKKHYEWAGKLEIKSRTPVTNKEQLSLAYTPGVAEPCLEIEKDYNKSFELTRRWNTVAVITDGTAVLGTCVAEALTRNGFATINQHNTIYIVEPEYKNFFLELF